jgi:hypothetical protein
VEVEFEFGVVLCERVNKQQRNYYVKDPDSRASESPQKKNATRVVPRAVAPTAATSDFCGDRAVHVLRWTHGQSHAMKSRQSYW